MPAAAAQPDRAVLALGAPHGLLAVVVGDQREVVVSAPPTDLVHAYGDEPVQTARVQTTRSQMRRSVSQSIRSRPVMLVLSALVAR